MLPYMGKPPNMSVAAAELLSDCCRHLKIRSGAHTARSSNPSTQPDPIRPI